MANMITILKDVEELVKTVRRVAHEQRSYRPQTIAELNQAADLLEKYRNDEIARARAKPDPYFADDHTVESCRAKFDNCTHYTPWDFKLP